MKKIAIVGFGFMGKTHFGAWRKCRGAKVVAVCDANLEQLTAKVTGNIAGVADNTALPKSVRIFDDFNQMLAVGGFDIVDITLPTRLHPKMTIAALKAGYHVLCEKPMALSLKDCEQMLSVADKMKRELLIAHCLRFFPAYRYVRELVRNEKYGKVIAADFSRFIAPPKWSPKGADWFLDEKQSGGVLFDVHIHDADYIFGAFGRPATVLTTVHKDEKGRIDHLSTVYGYPNAVITSDGSFAASQSLIFDGTARVFFERATVYLGDFFNTPLKIYPATGKPFMPKLSKTTGYEAEVRYFLSLVEGKTLRERILTARDARDAIALVEAERHSAMLGRRVKF